MITFSEFNAHTNPLFYEQKILKIEDIFKSQMLKLIYLYYIDKIPPAIRSLFTPSRETSPYDTRSTVNKSLKIPPVKTTHFGINSIFFKAPVTWNDHIKVSSKILEKTSLVTLKKYLNDFFISQYENTIL